jgi:type I restriction enzyme M protein
LHPNLKSNFVPVRKDLANPPFNMSNWGGENLRQDVRWKSGAAQHQALNLPLN